MPYTFLVLAMLLGFMAIIAPVSRRGSIVNEDDLKFVAGSVHEAPRLTSKGGLIGIRVDTDDGVQDLYVEDFSHYGKIMRLKPGDHITARVHHFLGDSRIWELKKDGVTIESYLDMYSYSIHELERGTTNALWSGLVASIFLAAAIGLRMYFGAWREPLSSVFAEQTTPDPLKAQPWKLT